MVWWWYTHSPFRARNLHLFLCCCNYVKHNHILNKNLRKIHIFQSYYVSHKWHFKIKLEHKILVEIKFSKIEWIFIFYWGNCNIWSRIKAVGLAGWMVENRGPQIFQKSRSHFQILWTRMLTWSSIVINHGSRMTCEPSCLVLSPWCILTHCVFFV